MYSTYILIYIPRSARFFQSRQRLHQELFSLCFEVEKFELVQSSASNTSLHLTLSDTEDFHRLRHGVCVCACVCVCITSLTLEFLH